MGQHVRFFVTWATIKGLDELYRFCMSLMELAYNKYTSWVGGDLECNNLIKTAFLIAKNDF